MRISDQQFEPDDAALDHLLAQARWPEPAQPDRLRQQWIAMSRRRRILPAVWSAAAAIAVIVGAAAMIELRPKPAFAPSSEKFMSIVFEPPAPPATSRPPTPYEKLAMIALAKKPASRSAPIKSVPPPPELSELQSQARDPSPAVRQKAMQLMLSRNDSAGVIAYLSCANDPKLSKDAAQALIAMPAPPREALLEQFDSPLIANRRAAARALGSICDARLAQRLDAMVQSGPNRREALAALLAAPTDLTGAMLADAALRNPIVHSEILVIRSESADMN